MRGHMNCPKCGTELKVMGTSYGCKATCEDCEIRWTKIFVNLGRNRLEADWHPEKWTGMRSNRD